MEYCGGRMRCAEWDECAGGENRGGVPGTVAGDVQQSHKDFWLYGKQLYVDLAHRYPKELQRID